MRRIGLVAKQLIGCGAVLLLAVATTYWLVAPVLRVHDQRVDQRRMDDLASSLVALGDPPERLTAQRLQVLASQWTATLARMDSDGEVLAEAFPDRDLLGEWPEIRVDDPEVLRAERFGSGDARREGPAAQSYRRRVVRLGNAGATEYIVVTIPQESQPIAPPILGRLSMAAALAGLLSMGWVFWSAWRLRAVVLELNRTAQAISREEDLPPPGIHRNDELGRLADSMRRMGRRINSRLAEVQEVSDQLSAVLRGMSDAVVAIDKRRRVLFANPSAQRLFGVNAAAISGRKLAELVRNRALHDAIGQFFETGTARRIELALGSEQRWLSVNLTELPGRERNGLILEFHDLTELRRLEKLRQEFVANVSHELKTPLSSIKAYAETLREGALDDPVHRLGFIQQIETQADRLHALILDLISLARIEAGEQTFNVVSVSLQQAAQWCVAVHQDRASRKDVRLSIDDQSPKGARVLADEEGLRQILDNLVDNAVKYTPPGGAVVIRWRDDGQPRRISVEVEDTGLGIPPEAHDRLFERFYRVDHARSRSLGGTGLGLSIVKHLAQAFGGTVSVVSQVGKGSRFNVSLPRSEHAESTA